MQFGLKTVTSFRAAIVSVLVCAALLALACMGMAFPAVTLSVCALMLMPVVLLLIAPLAGLIPMLTGLAMTVASLYAVGGWMLCGLGALYLAPMTAVYAACLLRKRPFWQTVGAVAGTLSLMLIVIFVLLQNMTGWQLYAAAGDAVADTLRTMPGRDTLLSMLCQAGLLRVPASMQETALVAVEGGYVLSAEVAEELTRQARTLVISFIQQLLPALLVSGSALNALMGVSLGLFYGRRAVRRRAYKRNEPEQDIPDLSMPPLSQWHIPRPWGMRIGIFAVGYLLMNLAGNETVYLLGALMWQVFYTCFAVQGLAAFHYSQKKRGTGRFWRVAIIAAAFMLPLVQTVLMVIGVLDQLTNTRGLRPPLAPRNNNGEE